MQLEARILSCLVMDFINCSKFSGFGQPNLEKKDGLGREFSPWQVGS